MNQKQQMRSIFRGLSPSASLLALGLTAATMTAIISAPVFAQDTNQTPTKTPDTSQTPGLSPDNTTPGSNTNQTPSTTPDPNQTPGLSPNNTTPGSNTNQTPNTTPDTNQTPGLSPNNTTPGTTPDTTTPSNTTPNSTTQGSTSFSDVQQDYWAAPFIQALAQRNVIVGFPDQTFRPDQPVTRAQFAAMIQKAFNQNATRQLSANGFSDVPSNYWAAAAIKTAYEEGFLAGYPDNSFRPNQEIPKAQAIISLTSGLGVTPSGNTSDVLNYYTDASSIPNYAVNGVAAATTASMVVNYPDLKTLSPLQTVTRAEAAALIYQALVKQGQLQPLPSNIAAASYVVGGTGVSQNPTQSGDIASIAASSDSFKTLTAALNAAGLTSTLQGQGPFTVFAPTDQAFAALPSDTLQKLLLPQNKKTLVKILTYHVVPGQLTASQLQSGAIKTAEGRNINVKIDTTNNQVAVNNAKIIQSGVQATNGVIYPIDQVLIPPNVSLSDLKGGNTANNGNGNGVDVGRSTVGGRSYIGVGGNIGLSGSNSLSVGNIAVISKLGLTRNISIRPSAVFGDDTIILAPITLDLSPRLGPGGFGISPYIGGGVAIRTNNNTDTAFLVTGGVDVPIANRFTINGQVNAAFFNDTSVGAIIGVGYNF